MFKGKKSFKIVAMLLAVILALPVFSVTAFATDGGASISTSGNGATTPLGNLETVIITGQYLYKAGNKSIDYSKATYKTSGGGYLGWYALTDKNAAIVANGGENTNTMDDDPNNPFSTKFNNLTAKDKRRFLENVFEICNAMADDTAKGYDTSETAVTEETVNDFYVLVQNTSGMGSQMLAAILQNTKPDYVTANNIYKPFAGVVGTILGLISIVIMSLLGVTMALDIAYIVIPAFQLLCGGADGNSDKAGIGGFVSAEAKSAVKSGAGGGGNGGDDKQLAIVTYFKSRWLGLVVLGLCLLYLVQGNIYSFVAWVIDLFSGFLGF